MPNPNSITDKGDKISCSCLIACSILLFIADKSFDNDVHVSSEPSNDVMLKTDTFKLLLLANILAAVGFTLSFNLLSPFCYRLLIRGAYWRTHICNMMQFIIFVSTIVMLTSTCSSNYCPLRYQQQLLVPEGVIGIVCAVMSWILLFYFPVPNPGVLIGGEYQVGTLSAKIEVENNIEFGAKSDPDHANDEAFFLTKHLSDIYKMPHFILRHLILARTNAKWTRSLDVDVSKKHPIVVYSHGLYGWRQCNQTTCEALASFGFMVFALDHSPDCMSNRLYAEKPDEGFYPFDFFVPKGASVEEDRQHHQRGANRRFNQIDSLLKVLVSPSIKSILENNKEGEGAGAHALQTSSDVESLPCPFVDLENLFIMGHSYGGMTAALAATRVNNRKFEDKMTSPTCKFKGLVMLDAWFYPFPDKDREEGAPRCSILSLSSHLWPYAKYQSPFRKNFIDNSKASNYKLNGNNPSERYFDFFIRDSNHQNFCDVYNLISKQVFYALYPKPPANPSTIGPNDPKIMGLQLDTMIVNFFLTLLNVDGGGLAKKKNPISELNEEDVKIVTPVSTPEIGKVTTSDSEVDTFINFACNNDNSNSNSDNSSNDAGVDNIAVLKSCTNKLKGVARSLLMTIDDPDCKATCFDETYFLKVRRDIDQALLP